MSHAAYASKTNERKKCTLNGRLVENSFHRVSHVKSARHLLKTMTQVFFVVLTALLPALLMYMINAIILYILRFTVAPPLIFACIITLL